MEWPAFDPARKHSSHMSFEAGWDLEGPNALQQFLICEA